MKRLLTHGIIVAYLGALAVGFVSHALKFGNASHPAMYFVVWDMFCGWSAYSSRIDVIAEGESGRYYEVTPAPWGEFKPYGPLGRRQYDSFNKLTPELVRNTLKHTSHEPITRVYVVEKVWPKQYNLPDRLWNQKYDEPKDVREYQHLKAICQANGDLIEAYPDWFRTQWLLSVNDNPRVRAEAMRGRPFFNVPWRGKRLDGHANIPEIDAPLGN